MWAGNGSENAAIASASKVACSCERYERIVPMLLSVTGGASTGVSGPDVFVEAGGVLFKLRDVIFVPSVAIVWI